jgi:hypothetical protein
MNVSPISRIASVNSEVFFDLDNKRERLSTLESQQGDPGFWTNQERARTVVQEVKILKNWVTPFDELNTRAADARGLPTCCTRSRTRAWNRSSRARCPGWTGMRAIEVAGDVAGSR